MAGSRPTRPRSILGLLAHLVRLRRGTAPSQVGQVGQLRQVGLLGLLGLTIALLVTASRCPLRRTEVATFNIRDFPESAGQIEGAFAAIAALDAPIVAVQEITDPAAFRAGAEQYLGERWQVTFGPYERAPRLLLPGVLFDGRRYRLEYARLHGDTRRGRMGRQTLEVRLIPRRRGQAIRVFVVHLKAGGDGTEVRRWQLRALAPLVARATRSTDEVVVLGDFNSTGELDRVHLQEFAARAELHWATESLACTSYWQPERECLGSALDHVFTSERPTSAAARGPCEQHGCTPGDRCPVFFDTVSDHCPVTASF